MNIFHVLGYTAHTYKYPIRPRQGEYIRKWDNKVSHVGKDAHAIDLIIPDPRVNPLPVYVPHDGIIVALVEDNDKWGKTEDFAGYLNYVRVQVNETEFYECSHIRKGSCKYKVGDTVKQGELLATTGVNGWMTDVRHHHFIVYKKVKGSDDGDYVSLRIRWDSAQKFAPAKT